MQQTVALPNSRTAVRLTFDTGKRLSDAEYWQFCIANPDLRVERSAEGEIIIVPPAGGESDYRNTEVAFHVAQWARQDGRGKAFGPTVQFILPDGSALSPDAAWVSNRSLKRLTHEERKKHLKLSPEFVVEVRSPSDRLKSAKDKMELWVSNVVELAWLIDGDAETVYIYRQGQAPETRRKIQEIAGEVPIKGFVLPLKSIWEGLG